MGSTETRVAIIGGGFAGSLTAAQLLRHAVEPLEIVLIERRFPFGSGPAFATSIPCHLLNVPAIRMSAYPDDPEHLVRWLRARGDELGSRLGLESAFLPRLVYGTYVEATLRAAAPGSKARLTRVIGNAVAVAVDPDAGRGEVSVRTEDGSVFAASHAVLALGNPPPADPLEGEALGSSRRYAADPWEERALEGLRDDDTVLTIGSNLTMVDIVLALDHRGHRGAILAVSPHGLLPQAQPVRLLAPPTPRANLAAPGVRALFRAIHEEAAAAVSHGSEWRSAVDSVRPLVASIWMSWPDRERRRFLRHARPYWEVHRHRMAPENAETISSLLASGRLRVIAGRIGRVSETGNALDVGIVHRGGARQETVRAARVVNCTGPGMDFRRSRDPLVRDLLERGLARPGSLGLGFDALADGALIGGNGTPSRSLFTLGPPLKGMYWETTAVPEIRTQAQALATRIVHGPTD